MPQKAPERYIAAMAVLARAPNIRGVLVGTGPLYEAVRARAREAGVSDRLIWVAEQKGEDLLPAFDVLVAPSLYEGMPYVLLEALAAGVPAVATGFGGVAEVVEDGITGFVVPQRDLRMLIEKIAQLVEDAPLRYRMAASSLRKSRTMSVERMVEQTLGVYQAALGTQRRETTPRAIGLGLGRG